MRYAPSEKAAMHQRFECMHIRGHLCSVQQTPCPLQLLVLAPGHCKSRLAEQSAGVAARAVCCAQVPLYCLQMCAALPVTLQTNTVFLQDGMEPLPGEEKICSYGVTGG
jgi:hypothetical protein